MGVMFGSGRWTSRPSSAPAMGAEQSREPAHECDERRPGARPVVVHANDRKTRDEQQRAIEVDDMNEMES